MFRVSRNVRLSRRLESSKTKFMHFFKSQKWYPNIPVTMQSTVCTLVVLVRYSNLHLYHVFPPGEKLYYTCLCVYINLIKFYKFVVKWFANRKQTTLQQIWATENLFFFLNICSSGIHKDITQCKKTLETFLLSAHRGLRDIPRMVMLFPGELIGQRAVISYLLISEAG